MNISQLRHPKEKLYRTLCLIIGGLIWLLLILSTVFTILFFLLPIALFLWIASRFFKVIMYGNAVHVNESQYSKINDIVQQTAQQLNMSNIPNVFVFNAQGATNAVAAKFLSGKYILLFSDLVDLLWEDSEKEEKIRFVIAHEMAHHAAGHVNFWINLIMKPAMLVPYLGAAYSRSCELTCDRIAAALVANKDASLQALITLASGSRELIAQTSIEAFTKQEQHVPAFSGFLVEIFSSHPRMTKRVLAVEAFSYHNGSNSPFIQVAREEATV